MAEVLTRKERPLGLLEKYQLSKQLTRAYGNVSMTATLEHPSLYSAGEHNIEKVYQQTLQPVLTRMIQTHPNLSITVRDKTESTAHLVQLNKINLADIVQISHTQPLQELIREQTSVEFDLDTLLPLWRLKVVPHSPTSCTIAFAAHHLACDGMSLTTFWSDLLKGLNDQARETSVADDQESLVVDVKEAKIPPPYELSNPPALSVVWDVMPVLCHSLIPKLLPTSVVRLIDPVSIDGWKGDHAAVEGEAHNTMVQLIHVSSNLWKPIIAEAKRQGVSPHSVIFMCMMLTWAKLYPDQTTEVSTPINCRGLCNPPVPNNQIGNYVGSYTSVWTGKQLKSQEELWSLSKKYNSDLKKNMVDGAKQALLMKYLPEFPASYCDFWYDKRKNSTMGRSGGIELSDLGRFPSLKSTDDWKVKEMYFCQSAQTFTNVFSLNSITVNEALYCTLIWQCGALDEDTICKFNDTFTSILKDIPTQTPIN